MVGSKRSCLAGVVQKNVLMVEHVKKYVPLPTVNEKQRRLFFVFQRALSIAKAEGSVTVKRLKQVKPFLLVNQL